MPEVAFFIDASKRLSWLDRFLDNCKSSPLVIHLSKPVEAYLGSILSRRRCWLIERCALSWALTNQGIYDHVSACQIPYYHVRYNDLVSDPKTVLRSISSFIGLSAELLHTDFWNYPCCYALGNPGTVLHYLANPAQHQEVSAYNFRQHAQQHQTFYLDSKWKRLLTKCEVDRLYALPEVTEQNRRLGYVHPYRQTSRIPEGARTLGHVISLLHSTTRKLKRSLAKQMPSRFRS